MLGTLFDIIAASVIVVVAVRFMRRRSALKHEESELCDAVRAFSEADACSGSEAPDDNDITT